MNLGPYLSNGALTPETFDKIVEDAWVQNWTIEQIKEARTFLSTYPVVACADQYRDIMETKRATALSTLQRALVRHYSQRLQDFFKSKEDFCD